MFLSKIRVKNYKSFRGNAFTRRLRNQESNFDYKSARLAESRPGMLCGHQTVLQHAINLI